jgi:hypothetical protein
MVHSTFIQFTMSLKTKYLQTICDGVQGEDFSAPSVLGYHLVHF